jgi:hypothetical protein
MNNALRSRPLNFNLGKLFNGAINQRGKAFGIMIIGALLAFEVFNFSTTEFALKDVLGSLSSPPNKERTNPPRSGTCSGPGSWLPP